MGKILVVDDDRAIRHLISEAFSETSHEVETADNVETALLVVRENHPDVVLLDIELPEISGFEAYSKIQALDPKLPVIYITGGGTSDTAIEAMKLGAFDYLLKPLNLATVREATNRAIEIRRVMSVPVGLSTALAPVDQGDQIIGRSSQMQDVFKAIGRVAPQGVTVLIRGESGTGKELVARAIYQHSDRREGPFLAVNCAAIPEQLLESELFGHEKGAFTGAESRRIGKFEQCNGGTIFLDEIGDMPPALQSKILRVIQQQEFQRVGGNSTIRIDVRILAATNRHLESMVADGEFREDLLYRLNGYSIHLPPLRERGDDLSLLIEHYLAKLSRELNRKVDGVATDTLEALRKYTWPGNIRELEGVLRQTLLQTNGTVVASEFLPDSVTGARSRKERIANEQASIEAPVEDDNREQCVASSCDLQAFVYERLQSESSDVYAETLEMMERFLLTEVLTRTAGNQSQASRILGITRGSLRHKIRSLGISIESKIGAGDS